MEEVTNAENPNPIYISLQSLQLRTTEISYSRTLSGAFYLFCLVNAFFSI